MHFHRNRNLSDTILIAFNITRDYVTYHQQQLHYCKNMSKKDYFVLAYRRTATFGKEIIFLKQARNHYLKSRKCDVVSRQDEYFLYLTHSQFKNIWNNFLLIHKNDSPYLKNLIGRHTIAESHRYESHFQIEEIFPSILNSFP